MAHALVKHLKSFLTFGRVLGRRRLGLAKNIARSRTLAYELVLIGWLRWAKAKIWRWLAPTR